MSDQAERPQYEVFADEFLEHAKDGFFNAHYDRPACLSLLGDVAGQRVLDAACGAGLYAAELLRRGAEVTGLRPEPPDGGNLPRAGRPGRVPRARPGRPDQLAARRLGRPGPVRARDR